MGGALSASTSSTCEALVATIIIIIFVIIIRIIVIIIVRSHFGSSMAQWVQSSPREGLFRALHIEIPPGILRPLFERPVNDLAARHTVLLRRHSRKTRHAIPAIFRLPSDAAHAARTGARCLPWALILDLLVLQRGHNDVIDVQALEAVCRRPFPRSGLACKECGVQGAEYECERCGGRFCGHCESRHWWQCR